MNRYKLSSLGLLVWFILCAFVVITIALYQRSVLLSELELESSNLHREVSQRADQHDAHLTALSTIAQSKEGIQSGVFEEVATTIKRFYPRIDEIQLVPLNQEEPPIGTTILEPHLAEAIRVAARSSSGIPELLTSDDRPGHYLIVKRSPNSEKMKDGLALSIDVAKLLSSETSFWQGDHVSLRLLMPDGALLYNRGQPSGPPQFLQPLGSTSQPLLLETGIHIGWLQMLPIRGLFVALTVVNILFFACVIMLRQRTYARRAERNAELSGLEARLAHASRINTMGEMASGMAHELTQPLTAILAGIQAGKHLLAAGNKPALQDAMDDVLAQARRASTILHRLRNWSRPQRQHEKRADFSASLLNMKALLAAEADKQQINIVVRLPAEPLIVAADPVEIEQVIFNLLRNAIEAFDKGSEMESREIVVSLTQNDGRAILEISDNGPGISADIQHELFTPFVTTKPDGMGLGLALSQRLIERSNGDISCLSLEKGTLFRVFLPLAKGGKE